MVFLGKIACFHIDANDRRRAPKKRDRRAARPAPPSLDLNFERVNDVNLATTSPSLNSLIDVKSPASTPEKNFGTKQKFFTNALDGLETNDKITKER
jgi:hypothetical protein